ncbi:outer membrane porin HofQ [Pirellulimonas nuda]|uniref:Outer membrane porin HofQ n=1 Tax=Pirellulimonas nuda TaxID=2528009 RepID=A0A518DHR6_9BACT|nr:general secretion pathway protein GspD [Pirellulimonas nuda]QDU91016.1 outer membrane porin HofQ [Pirellulimonas nuda]
MNAIINRKLAVLALALCMTGLPAAAVVGQAGAEKPPSAAEVEQLMLYARKAMEQGDLRQADVLLSRAEQGNVRYPLMHFGDTPAKVRRDLEKQQAASPAPNPFAPAGARPLPPPTPGDARPLTAGVAPSAYPSTATGAGAPDANLPPKQQAAKWLAEARAALQENDIDTAERLTLQATRLNLPDEAFGADELRPSTLAWDVQKARYQQQATGAVATAGGVAAHAPGAAQALYAPGDDPTGNVPASYVGEPRMAQRGEAIPLPLGATAGSNSAAGELLTQGEAALVAGDRTRALELFEQASGRQADLNPADQQRLRDHLSLLGATPQSLGAPEGRDGSMIDAASNQQQVLARQLSTDLGKRMIEARRIREGEPREAMKMLTEMRAEIANAQLAEQLQGQLIRRADAAIEEMDQYLVANRSTIELDERNAAVLADRDRAQTVKVKVQEETAKMVDQFNTLIDERRYEEAEVIARRLYEMSPDEPIAVQVLNQSRFIRRTMINRDQRLARDEGNWEALNAVDRASISNVSDGSEMVYDAERWKDLQKRRGLSDRGGRMSEKELDIQRKLQTPVQLRYDERPLSEVIEALSQMAGINVHLDPMGLQTESVSSDTPVTINLNSEISLKSALDLILEPLHLGYVIKSDVLKITSESKVQGDVYNEVYYVADLVIPIPNFVPNNNFGLQGLLNNAYSSLGYGNGLGAPGAMVLANDRGNKQGGRTPEGTLAQPLSGNGGLGGLGGGGQVPFGAGGVGGGAGGAALADFDSLIDLIISTVASDTWQENGGGVAEIRPFPTNLSLVISQTQAVHEEIADLLEQLRKLQDLQVTIEVRFIRLNDNFFERIGIDFDMNINDRIVGFNDLAPPTNSPYETPAPRLSVGLAAGTDAGDGLPEFTADLDMPFRQGSFDAAIPQIGGPVTGGATFGFAILSDIEAYFLINAAQGDRRTNVLNAPKVTLFNGQQAFVADTSQTPFVISVIPVVGEFAAAQQPVIVVLSEGTLMSIQAVVSDDRRYVRLTVVPFFSEIGDVQEFTFEGSTTTSMSMSTTDDDNNNSNSRDNASNITRTGTTVQLPTFQFISVTTTVSVPDGGTVLLGGIKRLSEGRNEFGVPLLSKIPYIDRLFRNVGIGRETDSLMMMVTPRIIIQEEEEEKLGISTP